MKNPKIMEILKKIFGKDVKIEKSQIVDIGRNVMMAYLSGNQTINTAHGTAVKVDLNGTRSHGNKLTFTSNGIKIGAGVSWVLVSYSIRFNWDFGDTGLVAFINKNGYQSSHTLSSSTNGYSRFRSVGTSSVLIDVLENDLLQLFFYPDGLTISNKTIGHNGTYLTVEVVE